MLRLFHVNMIIAVDRDGDGFGTNMYHEKLPEAVKTFTNVIESHGSGSNQTHPLHIVEISMTDVDTILDHQINSKDSLTIYDQ